MTVLFPLRESFESDPRLVCDEEIARSEAWMDLVDLSGEVCSVAEGCAVVDGCGAMVIMAGAPSGGAMLAAVLERVRLAIGGSNCNLRCGGCDGPSARLVRGCLVGD